MATPDELKQRRKIRESEVMQKGIDVAVVGGVAGGQVLTGVRADAQFFMLRRPDHIKPLESSGQLNPELSYDEQKYELHVMELQNSGDPKPPPALIGIAVVEGESLTWAMTQLIVAYAEKITAEHIEAGRIQTQ